MTPAKHAIVLLYRLLEVISNKILAIQKDDILLDCLNIMANKTFRIEEIPKEEMEVSKDELLIPCAHFQKVRHPGWK